MFQSFKRAAFLTKYNHVAGMITLTEMHMELQQKGWPANEFVDLFMRSYADEPKERVALSLAAYMLNQYLWVTNDDREALGNFYESLDQVRYRIHDRQNLIQWTSQFFEK